MAHTEGLQLRSLVKPDGQLEISLVTIPTPRPAADEVVVRVEASPLNPSDIGLLFGAADISTAQLSGSAALPVVTMRIPPAAMKAMAGRVGQSMPVGNEGAGIVVATGESAGAQALLGKTVAALLHHTCHPAHGYPHRWISADWPGFWSQAVCQHFGGSCVALVLNGFCGNILHANPLDPDFRSNIYLMGEKLMETTRRILPDLKPLSGVPLACVSRILPIPMRRLAASEIEQARALINDHPDPMWTDATKTNIKWDWVYALATLDLAEKQKKLNIIDYEVQVMRIGELAVVGCPGEPFVEAQLEIKTASPAKQTFAAHMCNGGTAGYVPTRQAFPYGGYETRVANWSCLDEGALEQVTAAARELLRDLYN